MATLGSNNLTLADHAKRVEPNGGICTDIVELLSQTNEMLDDMSWKEGNLPTGHRVIVRTGLPTVYWRQYNQGIPTSKSTTAQVDEQTGMLEAYSEVDKDLAELNGDLAAFRMSEAQPFVESINEEMQKKSIYGNTLLAPEEFTGLAIRYSDSTAVAGRNILKAGGSGSDNSSIYLVVWGDNTAFGVYPKGSKMGLVHEDLGLVTIETANGVAGARMRAYRDHWQWKCGVVVKDWRYVVRIANIDISNLVSKSSAADVTELMIKAMHRIPNLKAGRPAFYMNRTLAEMLDIQRRDDVQAGGQLNYEMVDGKRVNMFRGIPIRTVDQLLETEATVA